MDELRKIISKCESLLENTIKKSNRIGWIRFIVFFGGIFLVVIINFAVSSVASLLALLPITILFIFVSVIQSRFLARVKIQKHWIELKKSCLARSELDWNKILAAKEFQVDELTPHAIDLDITGDNSLHQLIDFSKTKEGSGLLRKFLLETPSDSNDVSSRQKLVKELLGKTHFRNKFLLTNYLSSSDEIKADNLLGWLDKSIRKKILLAKLKILLLLCPFSLISVAGFALGVLSIHWLSITIIYLAFYFFNQKYFINQLTEADLINDELKKIISTLEFIENAHQEPNSELWKLCSPLLSDKGSATKKLKKVDSIFSVLSLRSHPFIWFFIIISFPLDFYFAYKIEEYKEEIRDLLPAWLNVLHELEAFISLANFSHLNPDYTFPEYQLSSAENLVYLDAIGMGHPLIPKEKKVVNNYSLAGTGRIDIFTGSNMSGKSTFLRTVGINLCLANAGAAVNASDLKINRFKLFTCIRVSDSVTDGISYFYAEVKRLKSLLDKFGEPDSLPILFLIDEIFKGTNNQERLKGSEAMIHALAKKNGAGLISTHDLELVKLSDIISSLRNYHFKEEILDDKMIFDYKLHMGPCPTTNAIKIMQANGLPVNI